MLGGGEEEKVKMSDMKEITVPALTTADWGEGGSLEGLKGTKLFTRKLSPTSQEVQAVVILCHGFGEHSGRYNRLATVLGERGFKIYAMDHRGHGRSEGQRMYVWKFSEFIKDMVKFAGQVKEENPGKKLFLIGHSMGGLITVLTTNAAPHLFDGVVISAPLLYANIGIGVGVTARVMSRLNPKLKLSSEVDLSTMCSSEAVMEEFAKDELISKEPASLRLVSEMMKMAPRARKSAPKFSVPYLLMHGTADKMCLARGSEEFHRKTKVSDKTLRIYEGAYHELFHEPGAEKQALRETVEWLQARLPM